MIHGQKIDQATLVPYGARTGRGNRMKEPGSGKRSDQQAIARQRQLQELLAALPNRIRLQRPDDIVYALIADLEEKRTFPDAQYVLAGRLLTPRLAKFIESTGKHWVGQLEGRCPIQWEGPWLRLEQVAEKLRLESPQSFRVVTVQSANEAEEGKKLQIFSRSVRLDHYGRKRIVILHEAADLSDPPVFLFTDALFWEGHRIVQMWQYRWEEKMFF
jgi:hypothetical protein